MVLDLEYTPSHSFSKNLARIKFIQHIQNDLAKCNASRLDTKVAFLNQAYIFQLIAFWQVFVEDLSLYAFRRVAKTQPSCLFQEIAEAKLTEALKKFNTPNKENIDRLFKDVLGVQKISNSWQSAELPSGVAESTLAYLLETRHQIAHTGRTKNSLSYQTNYEKMEILFKMSELTQEHVLKHFGIK